MNREIKFRGKIIDNSGWAYGSLVVEVDKNYIALNINDNIKRDDYDVYMVEVIPRTVGQYAGLYDKNGKEIYEGDIVKITEKEKISKHKVIPMKPIIADIEWSEEYLTYTLITTSVKDAFESLTDYLDECDIEVIGNVTDSPELLGGE